MKKTLAIVSAALSLLIAQSAVAATILLQPGTEGKDAWLNSLSSNTNFGGHPHLTVNLFDNSANQGVFQFDLIDLDPLISNVTSATLSLYHESQSADGSTIFLYQNTSNWNEDTITYHTWNSPPQFGTAAVASHVIADTGFGLFRDFDVTTIAQGWISGAITNYGLTVAVSGNPLYLASSDHSVMDFRPKLVIEYDSAPAPVPEPGTMLLLGSGLVGLAGYGRKGKK